MTVWSSSTEAVSSSKTSRFVSLRWRLLSPLFLTVLVVAMIGAYVLSHNLTNGLQVSQENLLLQSSRAVTDRAMETFALYRAEARRIALTNGISEAVQAGDAETLQPLLESLANINDLESVVVVDEAGEEIIGIQRAIIGGRPDYVINTETDLSGQTLVRSVLDAGAAVETGFLRTAEQLTLYTAVPVSDGDEVVGATLVGAGIQQVLGNLRGSAVADLALYGPDGDLLHTTLELEDADSVLALDQARFAQAAQADDRLPVREVDIGEQAYQGAYQPFVFGPNQLGVVAALMPDDVPFITAVGKQLTALFVAVVVGVALTVSYIGYSYVADRVGQVSRTAKKLASGDAMARTGMQPTDEVGTAGYALDRYATCVQEKQDTMQRELRRQRREIQHMETIFETMQVGVVVQDREGRVLMINALARDMLGSQRVFRSAGLDDLADVVSQTLGPVLAPGIYALGDPQQVTLDEHIIQAQAAAVLSGAGQRIGTVLTLRDITQQVRQEQERDQMLRRLADEIQQPLAALGRQAARQESDMIGTFAREITRQAVALQKMIVDMQELATVDMIGVKRRQRPLSLDTLAWAIANEWRQVAAANNQTLHLMIERKGLYVLGDERRLRWAIGNVLDNAIKYTPSGGALTLEIKEESDGMANLRVRDNGVGIAREERGSVFMRFFRGTPHTEDDTPIQVPGMGQGLFITKQIIEAHGGKVWLKSSIGVGTAVYFTLPLTMPQGMSLPTVESQSDMDGETVEMTENLFSSLEDTDT